jgi:amino acid permease
MFLRNGNEVLPDYMAFITSQSIVLFIVTATRTSDSGEGCYSKNVCSVSVFFFFLILGVCTLFACVRSGDRGFLFRLRNVTIVG